VRPVICLRTGAKEISNLILGGGLILCDGYKVSVPPNIPA